MAKIVKLTESQLRKVIEKIINEDSNSFFPAAANAMGNMMGNTGSNMNKPTKSQSMVTITKTMQHFLSRYYKVSLKIDGNTYDPTYNQYKEKYFKEKGIAYKKEKGRIILRDFHTQYPKVKAIIDKDRQMLNSKSNPQTQGGMSSTVKSMAQKMF